MRSCTSIEALTSNTTRLPERSSPQSMPKYSRPMRCWIARSASIMPGIEHRGGIVQKRLFFRLHPWLIDHVGADVMHLPVVSDRQMIGQNLIADEDEAILPEMAVGGAIVDIFDQIVIGVGMLRQKSREFAGSSIFSKSSPPWVPTGRARMDGDGNGRPQCGRRKIGAGLLAQDFRERGSPVFPPADPRPHRAWCAAILRGIVDDRLAEPVGQIGGQRQHARRPGRHRKSD